MIEYEKIYKKNRLQALSECETCVTNWWPQEMIFWFSVILDFSFAILIMLVSVLDVKSWLPTQGREGILIIIFSLSDPFVLAHIYSDDDLSMLLLTQISLADKSVSPQSNSVSPRPVSQLCREGETSDTMSGYILSINCFVYIRKPGLVLEVENSTLGNYFFKEYLLNTHVLLVREQLSWLKIFNQRRKDITNTRLLCLFPDFYLKKAILCVFSNWKFAYELGTWKATCKCST